MNIAVLELEEKIRKMIAQDNSRIAIFEYQQRGPRISVAVGEVSGLVERVILTVSTFNESTKEITVMYNTKAELTKETCLSEVLHYLETVRPTLSPYTMIWKKKGDPGESNRSYFHCNDMLEILEKFFATRKREEYVIFSLEMKGIE